MADSQRCVGHELDVGLAACLLIGDRRRADRRRNRHLALAEVAVGRLQPGDDLVATEPGHVDRADSDTRDDSVREGAEGDHGYCRDNEQGCDGAHGEDEGNPGRTPGAGVGESRARERIAKSESATGRN